MFESLMAKFPADVRDSALKKVEGERPFLQAYKALMLWKEAWGAEFDVRLILDALRNNGLDELEQMTLGILHSECCCFLSDLKNYFFYKTMKCTNTGKICVKYIGRTE